MKTVTYEKVVFQCLSKAFEIHEKSPLYNIEGMFLDVPMVDRGLVDTFNGNYDIYRKIETENTPIQAAKDACLTAVECKDLNTVCDFEDFLNDDCNQKEFINICRAMAKAYDDANK